ncbi:MAG: hypothetical protein ACI4T2_01710 [Christensenellales bacterium]
MKQILWSKTILTAYRYLERIVSAIDKLVIKEAMGSISSDSLIYSLKSAETITNKILDYTEKKVALINVKLLIEKALYSMKKEQALILVKKYINGKKTNDIISEIGCPRRSYYRKLESATKTFAHVIKMMGFSEERFDQMLSDQKWLMKIYSKFELEQIEQTAKNFEFENDESSIFLQNLHKLNKVSLFN